MVAWAIVALVVSLGAFPLSANCGAAPVLSAPPIVTSKLPFPLSWTVEQLASSNFIVEESESPDFAGAETLPVSGAQSLLIEPRNDLMEPLRMHYRVRAMCEGGPSPWSATASTILTPPPAAEAGEFLLYAPAGIATSFRQDYLVPGFGESATNNDTFRITIDAPWLSVFPAQGALSAGGTTVQFTIDPAALPPGTSTTAERVERIQTAGTITSNVTVIVSLSGLVRPAARDASAPAGSRLIPAIAHADGFNSRFESDVRLTNVSSGPITYDLTYTPSGADGTVEGLKTAITIHGGSTAALDDIALAFFGLGILDRTGFGTLEIRAPGGEPLDTFASSRTFNVSPGGTFGQFIPALPAAAFVAAPATISLQQVASSATYRTNLGLVEGSGIGVDVIVRLFDGSGTELGAKPFTLGPYEHRQINLRDARLFPDVVLEDGRVEVEIASASGTATAYASVLDQRTADPLFVSPVQADQIASSRYVLPGIAELNTARNFHSDMRIFNASLSPVTVTLGYRPQSGDSTPAPTPVMITIEPRAVFAVDNVLPELWGLDGTAGAIVATTSADSSLVVTARTYSRDAGGGTFGQFIPAVTADDAVGTGERALQVLQLEQSASFRSNLGLFEVTGNPATVELFAHRANGASGPMVVVLQGGEFQQIGSILTRFGIVSESNARVSVRVIEGTGRVSAYGSVIDFRTEDPTYIPAQ